MHGPQLAQQILSTGWQSWSYEPYGSNPLIQIPQCIYAPKLYKELPNIETIAVSHKKPAYGWCSWYYYGWEIDENKILKNAEWIANNRQLPLDYILIDAGWANAGDWLEEDKKKFPSGLKDLALKIKSMGLKPGIWIGPFMVDPWSNLAKKHPDWLVSQDGQKIDGFRLTPWDKIFPFKKWILDMKNPNAREYIHQCIDRLVIECGMEMLKLDFLYSIYHDPALSIEQADQILKDFLRDIKTRHPNVYTIGCGCPLIPAIGSVDSMRLGSDSVVSPFVKFLPLAGLFDSLYIHKRVIKTLHDRSWMKKFWNIDPDAFICRPTAGLTTSQILSSQKVIKKVKGNIFLGDNLSLLSQKRIDYFIKPLFERD